MAQCAQYKTVQEIAQNLVVPRCGKNTACHATGSPFKPILDKADMIPANTVDKFSILSCTKDKLIDKASPAKSFMLAKVKATKSPVPCANAGGGTGGDPMPWIVMAGEMLLTPPEIACFEWYVNEISKQ